MLNRSLDQIFNVKAIAPAGLELHDLKPFQLAVFDEKTQRTVAAPLPKQKFSLVWKSPSKGIGGAFPDQFNAKVPIKSLPICYVDNVSVFESATDERKVFEAYLGWNGISACKGLKFECGTPYQIVIHAKGKPVRDVMGGRDFTETIPFMMDCCEDCTIETSTRAALTKVVKAIQNDAFYVNRFFDVHPLYSCVPEATPFAETAFTDYCLTLCDLGDDNALGEVQVAYQSINIRRADRIGANSVYQVDCASAQPAAYVTTARQPADCDTCPAGFTLGVARKKYIVSTENTGVGVDAAAWLAEVKLIDQSGADPFETAVSATRLSYEDGTSTYEVLMPLAFTSTAVYPNTTYMYVGNVAATCTQTTPVSTAWVACGTKYKIKRTMQATIKNGDCADPDADLDALTAYYDGFDDIVDGSVEAALAGDCITTYTLEQWSNCLEDGCDWKGSDTAKFADVPTYNGVNWVPIECEGWTFDEEGVPVPPAPAEAEACRLGIKFVGKNFENDLIECASDIYDSVETEGIELEVTISQYDLQPCNIMDVSWTVVQLPTTQQGLGITYLRQEIHDRQYQQYAYHSNRESDGAMLAGRRANSFTFDPDKLYHTVDLYHQYDANRSAQSHDASTREHITLAVEADKTLLFSQVKTLVNQITEATNGSTFI